MTTKPRTLEEIAYQTWEAVHTPGMLSREIILAALREAAEAARQPCPVCKSKDGGPSPEIALLQQNLAYARSKADVARQEEREALRALLAGADRDARGMSWDSIKIPCLLAWLDARSSQ